MNFVFAVEVPTRDVVPNDEFVEYGWFDGDGDEAAALGASSPSNVPYLVRAVLAL